MNLQQQRLRVLIAGILSLILMMGIARFSYTPLLPVMQQQAGLGLSEGGWLAAINYIGYLCGALIAALINNLYLKDRLYRIGLIVAVASTVIMGLTENFWLWALSRFFAGLSSAAGLLLGSGLILNWLLRNNFRSELGIHFAGVGIGIAFCALAVEIMNHSIPWHQQWVLFSIMGLLLLIPAWRWLPSPDSSTLTTAGNTLVDKPPDKLFLQIFLLAYFCAGVGYVISATFIVAIIDALPGLQGKGNWAFIALGLAAAPACIFWDLIARKIGNLNALLWTYVLQIIGIILPILDNSLIFALTGAALFGATFIGSVSLVLTMAGRYYPTRPAKMMGKMTAAYGVAQILAPAITGLMAEQSGNYANGLYMAAGVMVIGSLLIFKLRLLSTG